jgi:pimeloyl-ACP methyl ester carboxylesterase
MRTVELGVTITDAAVDEKARLPNHTTAVLHGVGHFLQSDAPEELSGAIRAWWAKLERDPLASDSGTDS